MDANETDVTTSTAENGEPKPLLNLTIRELPLKQAPMEAVIRRET